MEPEKAGLYSSFRFLSSVKLASLLNYAFRKYFKTPDISTRNTSAVNKLE